MADVNPIPEGYPRVSPHLLVADAQPTIDFLTKVLGANERMRMPGPDGKVIHAELEIGDSLVMLADVMPDGSSPAAPADTTVSFYVLVEDVDAVFAKAIAAGGTAISEPETMFYGDRTAIVADPSGHQWNIATHVEDVSPEEMERRMAAFGTA